VKFLATTLFLLAAVSLARPAAADPFARRNVHAYGSAATTAGSISVPAAWAGIWANVDTVYTCAGVFQSTSSDTDTLCTGQTLADSTFNCTGSFDANTFTEHCSATGEVFTDCQYDVVLDAHGTLTNDTFFSVSTLATTYSGTGAGCNLVPPHCEQTNSHETRIGPAPASFCATPTQVESWGQLKAHYR
jgi:hypothetical protein